MRTQLLRRGAAVRWPLAPVAHRRFLPLLPPVARRFASEPFDDRPFTNPRVRSKEDADRDLLTPPPGLWGRFVHGAYRYLGWALYPPHNNICNCGADMGHPIPKPELVTQVAQIQPKTREWRMQLYGAALYWHLATMPGEKMRSADTDMIRGKDVLEVACMRGGGARYLAEVAGPRRYVATDNLQQHIDQCKSLHTPMENLTFEVADAMQLQEAFDANSFDFVIVVQAAAQFQSLRTFLQGVQHVLRPGGRLLLADAFNRENLNDLLDAVDELGLVVDVQLDISRNVHAVGVCAVPRGLNYVRMSIRKVK